MDFLKLNGLAVDCIIGDLPQERVREQRLTLDVALALDLAPAAAQDDLAATVDYVALAAHIRAALRAARCRLVERAAARAAQVCLKDPRVAQVRVAVRKAGCVPGLASAEVVVEKSRADAR